MNSTLLAQARQIYQQALPDLFARRNVVACGLGYKNCDATNTHELSLIVSVTEKLPRVALKPRDVIPQSLDGMLTDVVQTGLLRAFQSPPTQARHRPAFSGISIGHYQITAGTFGLLLRRGTEVFILSNNHVLAAANQAQIGDPIYQPGPLDGGSVDDRIGTLVEYVPLDFGQAQGQCKVAQTIADVLNALAGATGSAHRLQSVQQTPGKNLVDVALARPDALDLVQPDILNIGLPTGVGEPALGMTVQKAGRTTGHTQGVVQQIDVTASVDYNGKTAYFVEQYMAGRMSAPGDSGSAILDLEGRVVGQLFAGSDYVTLFTPIQRILDLFRAEIVTA